jgi:hypothetical protein
MLQFHQDETCEGIIRHLERREGALRRDVRVRDQGNHTSPDARVEMTFWLGNQLFAIEHTGIEPFDGFMEHQNRAPTLFEPLVAAVTSKLGAILTPGTVFEMHLPIDGFVGRKMPEVLAVHSALANWAQTTALTLPPRKYADYRGTLLTARPPGVPFSVSFVRFDGIPSMPGRFQLKHTTGSSEEPRSLRVQRACEKKFPKLDVWKRLDGARTILVLEDNDLQTTNVDNVADAYLPIAKARPDAPDETYMVSTFASPWCVWPLLLDGRTYVDLANGDFYIRFAMDETGRLIDPT